MSKVDAIKKLFASQLGKNDVAFIYLGYSGIIAKTSNRTIIIDPADLLSGDDAKALKSVDLLVFTHSHGDHYKPDVTLSVFKATNTPVLAEPLVANDLTGKIPADKLTAATPGKTYTFGEVTVKTVQGIHRGPINLYQIMADGLTMFHAGDSGYVQVSSCPSNLAFLPTGTPSPTASPEYALKLALELKPSVAVTIHGSADQSRDFQAKMKEKLPQTSVIIPEPNVLKIVTLKKT